MKYCLYVFLAVLIIGGFLFYAEVRSLTQFTYKTTQLAMGGQVFVTEVADTPVLQERGLSYRSSIATTSAMLFAFPVSGHYLFWMKSMDFPIDMIWLSADKKVVYIERNVLPSTYPRTFGPSDLSRYVVEVASGTADRVGLTVGENVSFSCDSDSCK